MYPLTRQLYRDISHIAHFKKILIIFYEFNFHRFFPKWVLFKKLKKHKCLLSTVGLFIIEESYFGVWIVDRLALWGCLSP